MSPLALLGHQENPTMAPRCFQRSLYITGFSLHFWMLPPHDILDNELMHQHLPSVFLATEH